MMRSFTLNLLILAGAFVGPEGAAVAQQDTVPPASPGPVPTAFDSPRSTMFTFLRAVNAVGEGQVEQIDSATAALDLTAAGLDPESNTARRLTRDLWSALNRIREVRPEELADTASLRAGQTSFVYFPRPFNPDDEEILEQVDVGDGIIAFERMPDGRWLFSAETVSGVSQLSRILGELPQQVVVDEGLLEGQPEWVRIVVPAALRRGGFLGLQPWQWLGLVVVIFAGFVVDVIVRTLLRPIGSRLLRQFTPDDEAILADTVKALGLFAAALVWTVLIRGLYLTDPVAGVAWAATGLFAVLAGTWAGWKLIDFLGELLLHRAARTESKFDDILVPLLRKTAKLFVLALGVVYGAENLNINIVPLLTGLGIGGLAFAFAAKDTIENLFGSVAVVLDRPFEVGDWVVLGDVEGTVEELGFRSTRIRTFYNSQVTVPNAALVRATVDNYGRRQYRRWKTYLGVQYDTPPEKLLAFTEGIRELVRQHPYTRKDYHQIWCNDFANSSLNILLYVFHEVPDWSTELRERERLFLDIVRLADRLGVQFAFPTQTVHLFKEEHGPHESQYDIPHGTSDREALDAGVRLAREITSQQPWQRQTPGAVRFETTSGVVGDPQHGGDA